MKKLLLTSAGFENPEIGKRFLELVGKPAKEIKVIFIPTAATTDEAKFYVGKSKEELIGVDIAEQNIQTLELDHELSYAEVEGFDVIYVCGGNTFYLLDKARQAGFGEIVKRFLDDGKVYVGASAGSMLLGPSIEVTKLYDIIDYDYGVTDFTGLGFVDVAIAPHAGMDVETEQIAKFGKSVDYEVLALTDSQALLVINETKTVIPEGSTSQAPKIGSI